jgi:radical SAM protein with 4Fe4S-binding SPASM domain
MPTHDTVTALVFLDDSWRGRPAEEFAQDWLAPLTGHAGIHEVRLAGNVDQFAAVAGHPKVRVQAGGDETGRMIESAREAGTIVSLRHIAPHRFPLTPELIDATLDGYRRHAPGGYFQLDLADLPYTAMYAEVLGPNALAALRRRKMPLDWLEAELTRPGPFPVAKDSAPHAVRLGYLDNPHVEYFHFPKFIALEASRLCNLKCTMCALHSDFIDHSHTDHHPKHFDLGHYRSIIDQIQPYRDFLCVAPQFWGEPFMSPYLKEMIRYAKANGVRLSFTTNGTLWDDEMIDFMIEQKVDALCVSMDGATKETYEQVRIGASYDKVVRNLNRLLRRKRELGSAVPYLQINMALFPENRHEQDKLVQDWLGRANVVSISNHCVNSVVPELHHRPDRIPCPTLWEGMHINTNGDVIACCRDSSYEEVMGNVYTTPILDVWNNEKYRLFRKKHMLREWMDIPICGRCDSWTCKTRRVVRQGDLLIHQYPFYQHIHPVPGDVSKTVFSDAAASLVMAVKDAGQSLKRTLVNLTVRRKAS